MKNSNFTQEDYIPLKKAYNRAIKSEKDQFIYEGYSLLTAYTKYLLEYMEHTHSKIR